jgi:diguanylate cyclase (GGDEF)-like protein
MLSQLQLMLNTGIWQACPKRGVASWTSMTANLLGLEKSNQNSDIGQFLNCLNNEDYKKFKEMLELTASDAQARSISCTVNVQGEQSKTVLFNIAKNISQNAADLTILGTVKEDSESQSLAKMRRVACYDALTGLPNLLLFREQLSFATRAAKKDKSIIAALTIEVGDLRRISDAYGRSTSDQIIKAIGSRIETSIRASDAASSNNSFLQQGGLAKIESAQFAAVLNGIREPQDAARVARRLLDQMLAPIHIDGIENYAAISIGIAIFPWDGDNAEQLAQASSLALEHARKAGNNRAVFFNRSMNAQAADRLTIEAGLRKALDLGEFVLHYQHRVDGNNGKVLGNEALIRWLHPEKGIQYPGVFIGIAEESRLIVPIGNWVIEQACRQNRTWLDAGLPPVPVAVNVSAVQFATPGFLAVVKRALDLSGLPPHLLELEITESVVMADASQVITKLKELKKLGCLVAIDDFGTGFSSLSYLKDLPADYLKIDRSFVIASTLDRKGAAITQAIIDLASRLDMSVIAEGVETEEQRQLLLAQGCTDLQGYLFSKPCDADKTAASWRKANGLNRIAQAA